VRDPPLSFNAWLRFDVVRRMLRSVGGVGSILEVGAGQGAVGVRLARSYRYVGVEPDHTSFAVAERRLDGRGTVLLGDVSAVPPQERFDLVCAFEVLEHISDDAGALGEWRSRLRPGGRLLISVPAHARRFGAADRRVGHFRRYDRGDLVRVLDAAGFGSWQVACYGFPLGYALEAVRNAAARKEGDAPPPTEGTSASGRWHQPPDRFGWLTRLGTAPFRVAQRPFAASDLGTGFVAFARTAL
jgi:SAM-dependent methyltransferase